MENVALDPVKISCFRPSTVVKPSNRVAYQIEEARTIRIWRRFHYAVLIHETLHFFCCDCTAVVSGVTYEEKTTMTLYYLSHMCGVNETAEVD